MAHLSPTKSLRDGGFFSVLEISATNVQP
jgi:hypothetical protein